MAEPKYITRAEMYHWYLKNEYDDCFSFPQYIEYCAKNNVFIQEDNT